MANIAECAIAIAKTDINMLGGAFERIENTGCGYGKAVIKKTFENDATGETIYLYDITGGAPDYTRKIGLKKDGKIIKEYVGDQCNNCKAYDGLAERGYHITDEKYIKDEFYENGWKVDFVKLHTFSYDYEPRIQEYDDCVVLWFGGKWDFPHALEEFLDSTHATWQGAGLDDAMNWSFSNSGNADLGLRISEDSDYTDDEPYTYHFIEYRKEN